MACFFFRREDVLDVEVSASGFTKQMEKDLLTEMGINEQESNSDSGTDDGDRTEETGNQSKANELEELREMFERTLLGDERERNGTYSFFNKKEYVDENIVQEKMKEENTAVQCTEGKQEKTNLISSGMILQESVNNVSNQKDNFVTHDTGRSPQDIDEVFRHACEHLSNISLQETHLFIERNYGNHCDSDDIVKSISIKSDSHSVRSVSTTSTIPPEVIRSRVKKALEKREKAATRQRCLAKGEASAVTRKRRENRDTIKDCSGIWG